MTQNGTANGAVRPTRFASGAAVKLPLSDGDWVLVHAELTYGQQRRLASAGLTGVPAALAEQGGGAPLTVDLAAYDIERLCAWVMDWSFRDGEGDRVVVTREAIESLHPDTAAEIQKVLDAHVEALEAKKAPAGGVTAPAATSSSAKPSAGAGKR